MLEGFGPAPPAPPVPTAVPALGVGRCATRGPRTIRGPPGLVAVAPVLLADDSRRSEDETDGVRDGGEEARRPGRLLVGVLRPLVGGDVGDRGVCDGGDGEVAGGEGKGAAGVAFTAFLTGSLRGASVTTCSGCCWKGARTGGGGAGAGSGGAATWEGAITITEFVRPTLESSSVSGGGSTNVGRGGNPPSVLCC